MSHVVLDIETLGFPVESFDEIQQKYLLKFAETDAERLETIQKLSLYPTTAQIIAIGMLNPETNRAKILFQSDEKLDYHSDDELVHFKSGSEKEIVEQFWLDIGHYDQFVTFNGRGFDCPFLMLRSAILQVQPTRNLMPYRYDASIHCDLLEQFTFYGALRKFNLDFYCKSFGIESPKAHGVTGLDMKQLTDEKRFREIAEYNLRDLQATAELFRRWEKFLSV
ncbi:MAG: ribonuclease H-like domain-containing protein [Ignavibacteriales bacterium]|nr:ribonuclease H-like domain-containing protein [Ignavibacteriales bacterium]